MTQPAPRSPHDETVVVLQPHHLGDLLVSTPALHALRGALPAARIVAAVGPWGAPLLAGNPDVDAVVTIAPPWLDRSRRAGWASLRRELHALRALAPDRLVVLPTSAKVAALAWRIRAPERWGLDHALARWAFTHRVPYDAERRVVESYLDVARALGAAVAPPVYRVFPDAVDTAPADALLAHGATALLAVTAGGAGKNWLAPAWAAVGDALHARGLRVVVCGGPGDAAPVAAVRAQMHAPADVLAGELALLQFAALVRGARLVVALDTFAAHLAAAVATPLVCIRGSASVPRWLPYAPASPCEVVEVASRLDEPGALASATVIAAAERALAACSTGPWPGSM